MTATYETKPYKGHYVAKLDGEGGRFGLERTFENGTIVKSRKVRVFKLSAGWYEHGYVLPKSERKPTCGECGHREDGKRKAYFGVTAAGELVTVPDSMAGNVGKISAGPDPLEPGAWNSAKCRCGADVDGYTPEGFPHCDQHAPQQSATATDTEGLIAA